MAKVRVLKGEDVLVGFTLADQPLTLGRGHEADIYVPHRQLSRKHCRLEIDADGAVVVTDLASLNGVFCKGGRVPQAVIGPEGEFFVGDLKVVIEPEKFKVGTVESAVPGEDTATMLAGVRSPGEDTMTFLAGVQPGGASRLHADVPRGMTACARALERVVNDLSALYDDMDRALGREARHAPLLDRLKAVTIHAEALVGD